MENTPNLGLKRWDGGDRILHSEFNDNWDKIDTALAARNCRFYTASYTGDGELTKTWTFPSKPVLIILTSPTDYFLSVINAREGHGLSHFGMNSVTHISCTVEGNSATWSVKDQSSSWMGNSSNTKYGMFAILET